MRARVPLDVDLEDRLLYGLTATRLVYLLIGLLGGFALWSAHWAGQPVRAATCLIAVGLGAGIAWGRWRGRALDSWLADLALYAARGYRVVWNKRWLSPGRP